MQAIQEFRDLERSAADGERPAYRHRRGVDIDVDQAFVPGVRHGYAIPSYKTKRGGAAPGAQTKVVEGLAASAAGQHCHGEAKHDVMKNQPLAPALLEPGTSPSSPVGGELLQSCDELQKSSFAWLKAHSQGASGSILALFRGASSLTSGVSCSIRHTLTRTKDHVFKRVILVRFISFIDAIQSRR